MPAERFWDRRVLNIPSEAIKNKKRRNKTAEKHGVTSQWRKPLAGVQDFTASVGVFKAQAMGPTPQKGKVGDRWSKGRRRKTVSRSIVAFIIKTRNSYKNPSKELISYLLSHFYNISRTPAASNINSSAFHLLFVTSQMLNLIYFFFIFISFYFKCPNHIIKLPYYHILWVVVLNKWGFWPPEGIR